LSGAEPLATQAVQGLNLLGLYCFDRHLANVGASRSLDQRGGVGLIGFIASYIGLHIMSRQQAHRVPESADPARPVVRAATGFHHDLARRKLNEEGEEFPPSQSLTLRNAPVSIRDGELKIFFAKSTPTIVAFISDSFW
jgi:hypothetical protein